MLRVVEQHESRPSVAPCATRRHLRQINTNSTLCWFLRPLSFTGWLGLHVSVSACNRSVLAAAWSFTSSSRSPGWSPARAAAESEGAVSTFTPVSVGAPFSDISPAPTRLRTVAPIQTIVDRRRVTARVADGVSSHFAISGARASFRNFFEQTPYSLGERLAIPRRRAGDSSRREKSPLTGSTNCASPSSEAASCPDN